MHLYFLHDATVSSTAGAIAQGVDTRGNGGYVILWDPDALLSAIARSNIATWPNWLRLPATHVARSRVGGDVLADRHQISILVNAVLTARAGKRNSLLYWAARRLAELQWLKASQLDEASQQLIGAAVRVGLDEQEAECTVQSAFRGAAKDRSCKSPRS